VGSTTLNLLARDGALTVTFSPALTTQQYEELVRVVHAFATKEELRAVLEQAARNWGRSVAVDD
jgi:hypothetical protein